MPNPYHILDEYLLRIPLLSITDYREWMQREQSLKQYINQINTQSSLALEDILSSLIHMTINRAFTSQQRLHEMMIYDFLTKKTKSKRARYGKL